jgi:hypothetical protein
MIEIEYYATDRSRWLSELRRLGAEYDRESAAEDALVREGAPAALIAAARARVEALDAEMLPIHRAIYLLVTVAEGCC